MSVWSPWHPKHGFEIPHFFEGPIAFASLDPQLARIIRELNRPDGTNNRNGWRAVKVQLVKGAGMSATKAAREALKSYIERIENLVEQIVALKDDQKAVFAEAKADGFDPKSMRRIIKRRQKDPGELAENEAIDDTYMHALGMASESALHVQVSRLVRDGMSRDQVIEAFQMLVPVNGEVIASVGGAPMRIWRTEDGKAFAEDYVPPLFENFMKKRGAA
ncbi:DUF2312 domain-containing protein [Bradyrhizobium sp. BR 1433]|uniref:DUF2312 domain-containing protein n=1 Tax=Bradyrhizobium sp. BR 1433 TaxID=3447967 RepID=UPI003EE6F9EB